MIAAPATWGSGKSMTAPRAQSSAGTPTRPGVRKAASGPARAKRGAGSTPDAAVPPAREAAQEGKQQPA
eukprot:2394305-Lingulodinium_polyedra.AAC.1